MGLLPESIGCSVLRRTWPRIASISCQSETIRFVILRMHNRNIDRIMIDMIGIGGSEWPGRTPLHETERHGSFCRRPVAAGRDGVGSGRADGHVRSDDPARHRGAACRRASCAGCAAAPRRSTRRSSGGLVGRPFSVNETINIGAEARHRPGGRRAVQGRRADHHQWRHHDLPDGALPDRPPACRCSPTRFAIAEHLLHNSQEHGDACPAARSIASRTSFCRPSTTTWPAISTPSACSWAARASARTG